MRKAAIAGLMMALAPGLGSKAFAWGCVAASSDGAYSYNWPSEQDAQSNAINECADRSLTDDCVAQSCDPTQ